MAWKNESGFSLVELLIAISIIAVGLLGTATMLSTNMGSNRFSQIVTVEASLVSSEIEDLMSRPGSDAVFASNVVGAVYDLDPATAASTVSVQGRTYSATYSITRNTPVTGVARIDSTVTSSGRSITMTSYKSII